MDDLGDFQAASDFQIDALLRIRDELRSRAKEIAQRASSLREKKEACVERHKGKTVRTTDKIKLNVGGMRVVCSRATLTVFPNTFLAAMFSGRWESRLLRDKKGRVFLDVNPTCFRKLIDYLTLCRTAPADSPPAIPKVPADLESTFDGLIDLFGFDIEDSVQHNRSRSKLIPEIHFDQLIKWLEEAGLPDLEPSSLNLLYSGSEDGFDATQFHHLCDNKGPTLTVIRSRGGWIFGGYSDISWSSENAHHHSTKSFLFSLNNPYGSGPTKLALNGNKNQYSILCNADHGPAFGGGSDLHIASNANLNTSSYSTLGRTFFAPNGNEHFLAGKRAFQVEEIEVFGFVSFRASEYYMARSLVDVTKQRLRRQLELQESQDIQVSSSSMKATMNVDRSSMEEICTQIVQTLELEKAVIQVDLKEQTMEEERFAQEVAFIDYITAGEPQDIVDLNVSGEKMSVRRSTLRVFKESVLDRQFDDTMWSQGLEQDDEDEDDESGILIEQPSYSFGKLIDYLRLASNTAPSGVKSPTPSVVVHERKTFRSVVKYYFPGCERCIFGPIHSEILQSRDHVDQVLSWLEEVGLPDVEIESLNLLYSGSEDGFDATQFHYLCDNKGPTLTVIRSRRGWIFGGYSDISWSSENAHHHSTKSFLFSLINPSGSGPTKLALNSNKNQYSILCNADHGPTFGGGSDLHIASDANLNTWSHSILGSTYFAPNGNGHFLTGKRAFQVEEMEVFGFSNARV